MSTLLTVESRQADSAEKKQTRAEVENETQFAKHLHGAGVGCLRHSGGLGFRRAHDRIQARMILCRQPMSRSRIRSFLLVIALAVLSGCATRPINARLEQVDLNKGYRYETRWEHRHVYDSENLVILAFSGRWHPCCRIRIRSPRSPAAHGAHLADGQEHPHARRSGHRHRRVRGCVHRAGLWLVRRQAI